MEESRNWYRYCNSTFLTGMEVLVIREYKKRKMLNKDESGMENSYETAKIG